MVGGRVGEYVEMTREHGTHGWSRGHDPSNVGRPVDAGMGGNCTGRWEDAKRCRQNGESGGQGQQVYMCVEAEGYEAA
jgi:hypothetical protein